MGLGKTLQVSLSSEPEFLSYRSGFCTMVSFVFEGDLIQRRFPKIHGR